MSRDCFSGSRRVVVGRTVAFLGASILSTLAGCILVASNQKCRQDGPGPRVVYGGEEVGGAGGSIEEAAQLGSAQMNE